MLLNSKSVPAVGRLLAIPFLLLATTNPSSPSWLAGAFSFPSSSVSSAPRVLDWFQSTTTQQNGFRPSFSLYSSPTDSNNGNDKNDEAARLQKKAQDLRDQIRQMEEQMGEQGRRSNNNDEYIKSKEINNPDENNDPTKKSLKNKRILILGANGRLGSMVTRHLLRTHPELSEVVAAVHYVGEATTRGYGRLSYEVGAEDGIGSIGAAWSPEEERNASFEFNPEVMGGYNLNKLRVVEVELLNPVQVRTICEGMDAVIFCATDFEGNRPRAIASLNAAFLFRAVADPLKGRVEIEGVRNSLEGLVGDLTERRWKERKVAELTGGSVPTTTSTTSASSTDPTQFILVSTTPCAFGEFETPFGEFNGLKRQAERIVEKEFPSLSYSILQMGLYDERMGEGMEIFHEVVSEDDDANSADSDDDNTQGSGYSIWNEVKQKRINRRDAARAVVEALLDDDLVNMKVQCYTTIR